MEENKEILNKKIDFMLTIEVRNANPNGDPLNGNMPRVDYDGYGEISDVAIKRKIRNRRQDMGKEIFVKSNDRIDDGFKSLEKRFKSIEFINDKNEKVEIKKENEEIIHRISCEKWIDVRGFGQVMAFKNKKNQKEKGFSLGVRGPISISLAKSLSPVTVQTMQITRSTNGMEKDGKSSDTMGNKHFVEYGVYIVKGSVNCFFAEKTGFTEEDVKDLKEALKTLFVNDASSARPEGSMSVKELFWFEHNSKLGKVSAAKIYELLKYNKEENMGMFTKYSDYNIRLDEEKMKEYDIVYGKIEGDDNEKIENNKNSCMVERIEGI